MHSSALKLAILIIAAAAITLGLLALRHQRIQTAHQIMLQHKRINAARQDMWDMQVRIADRTTPHALEQAVNRAHLNLEPLVDAHGEQSREQ